MKARGWRNGRGCTRTVERVLAQLAALAAHARRFASGTSARTGRGDLRSGPAAARLAWALGRPRLAVRSGASGRAGGLLLCAWASLAGMRRAYARRTWTYWLSPLADWRSRATGALSVLRRTHAWRGRDARRGAAPMKRDPRCAAHPGGRRSAPLRADPGALRHPGRRSRIRRRSWKTPARRGLRVRDEPDRRRGDVLGCACDAGVRFRDVGARRTLIFLVVSFGSRRPPS